MRKIFSIGFLAVYLFLTAGVNIIIHTCGGEATASIETTKYEDPCGCNDEMNAEDVCCTTKITALQIDDVQLSSIPFVPKIISAIDILPVEIFTYPVLAQRNTTNFINGISPPPTATINISNCVFLI